VLFHHANGSVYGAALQPQALEAQAELFSALRHLGFKEREVRVAFAEVRAERSAAPAAPITAPTLNDAPGAQRARPRWLPVRHCPALR
jgi:Holliday junction resolvasome RuvABC DNA-binding subunit